MAARSWFASASARSVDIYDRRGLEAVTVYNKPVLSSSWDSRESSDLQVVKNGVDGRITVLTASVKANMKRFEGVTAAARAWLAAAQNSGDGSLTSAIRSVTSDLEKQPSPALIALFCVVDGPAQVHMDMWRTVGNIYVKAALEYFLSKFEAMGDDSWDLGVVSTLKDKFVFTGFDPIRVKKVLTERALEAGVSRETFQSDMVSLICFALVRSYNIDKRSDRTSDDGARVMTKLIQRYRIQKNVVRSDPSSVNLSRVVSAFPMLAAQVLLKLDKLPYEFSAFPSLVPKNEKYESVLSLWKDWAIKRDMTIKKVSLKEATDSVAFFGKLSHDSSLYSEEARVSAMAALGQKPSDTRVPNIFQISEGFKPEASAFAESLGLRILDEWAAASSIDRRVIASSTMKSAMLAQLMANGIEAGVARRIVDRWVSYNLVMDESLEEPPFGELDIEAGLEAPRAPPSSSAPATSSSSTSTSRSFSSVASQPAPPRGGPKRR